MEGAIVLIPFVVGLALLAAQPEQVLESFDAEALPANMLQNRVHAERVPREGGGALRVDFEKSDWPNVFFTPPEGQTWDWSAFAGLAVEVTNPGSEPVEACIRIDNAGADGLNRCNTARATVPAGATITFRAYMHTGDADTFWGMRGIPERGPVSQGPVIDPARITAFQVYLPMPDRPHALVLDNIRLFGKGGPLDEAVPLPFVDRFGQYKHADWPGKLHEESELAARRDAEEKALAAAPELPERDRFGGWAAGPQLEATGHFRTEKVEGKWWLVTPDGHLFFSTGIDCVGTWENTFIEGRDGWFEWLPEPDGPFKGMFGYQSDVHSMADKIGGKGRTFNWYAANLYRKYGEDWSARWRDTSLKRLKAWGFNTIGNWSQEDVVAQNALPYTATGGLWGEFREVEGGRGYWGRMKDVYDPRFAELAERALAQVAAKHAGNPMCIGYYVDNELSWGSPSGHDIGVWALASPVDQPCRVELVARLKGKYGSLEALNQAWGTQAADWDALRAPGPPNEACATDLDAFVYEFARRYFEVVAGALHKHAPGKLYLGCRFSGPPSAEVIRACAESADVVSFNIYRRGIDCAQWTGSNDLGKPILIGEFHFGALDRGMFHTGLVPTGDQKERAACYRAYVQSVADCPAFVGCHWFQYVDEPVTGRTYDGENYNIGFVTVTDTPYPELVEAARAVHTEIYGRRYGADAREKAAMVSLPGFRGVKKESEQ